MGKVAFELRADAEEFSGGTVSLPDGEMFNVGEALEEGKGKIVLDPEQAEIPGKGKEADEKREEEGKRAAHESNVIEALTRYPALKTTTVGEPASKPSSKAGDEKKGD